MLFHMLSIGDVFNYKGVDYVKIIPVKKNCCIVAFNAIKLGMPKNKKYGIKVANNQPVQLIKKKS